MTLFKPLPINDQSRMLASHMPVGRAWSSVFNADSNIGKLVIGLSIEFYRLELMTKNISDEMNVNKIVDLIGEWERSVGIPDTCFKNTGNIEKRRVQVLGKLSKFGGVQKEEDFIRVAALFGYTITVSRPSRTGPYPLAPPLDFIDSLKTATHTILITISSISSPDTFPVIFPISFTSGAVAFLSCIFNALAPANVQVVFI